MKDKDFFDNFMIFFKDKYDKSVIYDLVIKHIDLDKWEQQIIINKKFKEKYPEKKRWKRYKSINFKYFKNIT
tara:strand:- start:415 stop:630 length:216 start_codon:yes stop_codon:yes gene_type:complete